MNNSDSEILKFGLSQDDLISFLKIFKENEKISRVILFGSRAIGNYSNGSDIDIAIMGHGLTINDIIALNVDLQNLMLPYKFDILIYDKISEPALKEHIDRVGVVLYQK